MIYEVCEMVTTHLKDATRGVNALRVSVPLGGGDPALEAATIKSEFDINYLPMGRIPPTAYGAGPLVLVRRADDIGEFAPPGNPEIMSDDSRVGVAVLVLYPRQSAHSLDVENRRLSAMLRVVARSLALWIEELTLDQRTLRDVLVVSLLGAVRMVPTVTTIGGEDSTDLAAGAVLMDLRVTDRWAENITPLAP
jgi:hypothetical protein